MKTLSAWLVLALVFLAELVALAALFVSGREAWGYPAGVGLVVGGAALWGLFAAPRARFAIPLAGLVVKVVVLGGAVAGLWWTGHRGSALAVGVFVVVVHSLAALPAVRAVRVAGAPPVGGG